ncbi:transmembrane protein [Cystoisospora suis]|uniref:Transmembrane protein n=1 Tax=Cystoisospora suis TaxID=483139 RepID=A0A2C6KGT7_9APIC|nr:transmembrane protein [Cystoisospora suis]
MKIRSHSQAVARGSDFVLNDLSLLGSISVGCALQRGRFADASWNGTALVAARYLLLSLWPFPVDYTRVRAFVLVTVYSRTLCARQFKVDAVALPFFMAVALSTKVTSRTSRVMATAVSLLSARRVPMSVVSFFFVLAFILLSGHHFSSRSAPLPRFKFILGTAAAKTTDSARKGTTVHKQESISSAIVGDNGLGAAKAEGKPKSKEKQREKLLRDMKALLDESPEFRKVKEQKHRDALLEPYRAEDGDLSLETNALYNEEVTRFKQLQERRGSADSIMATGGAMAVASVASIFALGQNTNLKTLDDHRAQKRSMLAVGAVGLLGALSFAAGLWQRRRMKKKMQKLERRLVRMEKEAVAGHTPEDVPLLGVDEETPDMKRKRLREERKQQQLQQEQ